MIETLEQLVAPLSVGEFRAAQDSRAPRLLRRAGNAGHADLVNWAMLREMFARGECPADYTRVTQEKSRVPPTFFATLGKTDLKKIDALQAKGTSIIVSRMERFTPHLARLCERIEAEIHEGMSVNVVVTTGALGALPMHHDVEDLLVLQIEGSKRWQLFGTPVERPVKRMDDPPAVPGPPYFDEVLSAGDMLLLPSGSWHHCHNGPDRSVHIAVAFMPATPAEAMRTFARQLRNELPFRMPLTRMTPAELAVFEAETKARLREKIDQLSFRDFIAARRLD